MGKGNLIIYDIDNTLFRTDAAVRVIRGNEILRISASSYHDYVRQPGDIEDFSEHSNADLFSKTARPIWPVVKMAQADINRRDKNNAVMFLTGRPFPDNLEKFKNTFNKFGMDSQKSIFEFVGLQGFNSTAHGKVERIKSYVNSGLIQSVRVFDDGMNNLKQIHLLNNTHPHINFETFLVDSNGNIKKYPS